MQGAWGPIIGRPYLGRGQGRFSWGGDVESEIGRVNRIQLSGGEFGNARSRCSKQEGHVGRLKARPPSRSESRTSIVEVYRTQVSLAPK